MAFRTQRQLRHSAALRMRDLWTGTLTNQIVAGGLQIDDSSRQETPGFFRNAYIQIDILNPQHLRVVDNSGGLISIGEPGSSGTVTATTAYELHKIASASEYNQFIADAVLDATNEIILGNKSDETLVITANALKAGGLENEYTLPTGFRYISEIMVTNAGGAFENMIPQKEYDLLPGSTKKLRLSPWALHNFCAVGRTLRLLGMGEQDISALTDSTTISCDASFITEFVELQILKLRAGGTGAAADAARLRLTQQAQIVELKRESAAHEARALPGVRVVPL